MQRSIKIISGGQTGADRAGLEFAFQHNIPYGGYIPLRRKSEDGEVPRKYEDMMECASSDYRVRTELNVKEGDVTVVFTRCPIKEVSSGSWLTIAFAKKMKKPWLHIDVGASRPNSEMLDRFLDEQYAKWYHMGEGLMFTINIAGSRESKTPGMEMAVLAILEQSKFLFTKDS